MVYSVAHFINGQISGDQNAPAKPIFNPATGDCIGQVPIADQRVCDQAVASANRAWLTWAHTTPSKRMQILLQFRSLLLENMTHLASLVTQENGKTLEDAKGSIARGIEVVEFHGGLLSQLQGQFSANVSQQIDCSTFRQPLGVCAGVSPFNFPVMVPIWMMIPAIASGNTFILKPSEQDPSAALFLVELLYHAGLPSGVVNCVHGDASTVKHLLTHPDIQAITAVASTPVAEMIYQQASLAGKRVHTFGGAKNHAVIMPDADFAQIGKIISGAAFGSAGERCMAISVIVTVGEDSAAQLLEVLIPEIQTIKIGSGSDPDTEMGPLISQAHQQRVISQIDQGVAEGAQLIIDGRKYQNRHHPHGYYLGPCLFDHVNETMSIYQNELFGPVLIIVRVATLDEAIALVNRNQFGNGTAIFTQNGCAARHYSHAVQVGMVGINIPIPVPIASHPFGGWKRSSFGVMAMHGQESIHFYTKSKTITTKWFTTHTPTSQFVMPKHE